MSAAWQAGVTGGRRGDWSPVPAWSLRQRRVGRLLIHVANRKVRLVTVTASVARPMPKLATNAVLELRLN